MSEIKVNLVSPRSGTTVTLGESGDTIALGTGASQTGFGSECMSWCSSVKTALFTAVAGKGYFINTCGGGYTVTLPATASAGDEINFTDYARTWATACKALTLNQNSLKFQGFTSPNPIYDTEGATVKLVYSGATQGWLPQLDKGTELETPQTYNVQYLVVAGGGGGGPGEQAGGGGAGGLRNVPAKTFSVSGGATIPITVGGGGAAPTHPGTAVAGADSIFSTITSAGGGYGGQGTNDAGTGTPTKNGDPGGSAGGGASTCGVGGTGNVPCVSPAQGKDGGDANVPTGPNVSGAGGGGGHTCAGANGTSTTGGGGGDGTVCGIRGAPFDPVAYGGGGGGAVFTGSSSTGGAGGGGASGTNGPPFVAATAGGVNTGGGGGGSGIGEGGPDTGSGGAGGSGIVILRRLTACSTSTSGTVTTCGSDTIHTFTGDGTFVA
jgi:hypothetical protein